MVIGMSLTQMERLQLNKQVDRIFHAPGNMITGQQPEMAFVIDTTCEIENVKSTLQDAVAALKAHDKMFQNVRSNVVYWQTDKQEKPLITETMPMSFLQLGKPFDMHREYWEQNENVDKGLILDDLCAYLKLYHARSKCILVFTKGAYEVRDKKKVQESLNPFLKSKLLLIEPQKMITGTMLHMEMHR